MSTSAAAALPVRARNALASLLAAVFGGAATVEDLGAARRILSTAPGESLEPAGRVGTARSIEALVACGVVQQAAGDGAGKGESVGLVRRRADGERQLMARLELYLAVVPRAPIGASLPARIAQSRQLFAVRLFFEAHEILEAAWGSAGGDERRALQGLIQAAAAWEHWQHGRRSAAARLLAKAAGHLEATAATCVRLQMSEVLAAAATWRRWLGEAAGAQDAVPPPFPFAGEGAAKPRGRSDD